MKDYLTDYAHTYIILAIALLCAFLVISGNGDKDFWDILGSMF